MQLTTEIFGEVVVVHAPEELGRDQADSFLGFVTSLDRRNVVVDLDNTESIDSGGLEAMLKCQDLLREKAGDVTVATTNNVNRKILEITRLDQRIEVFDSVIDAVRSFV
ncbi:MAG: anti-sigma factor antagonist [Planctomycetota bacterium]|nr:MAG: anti-sigma factor antagonist [Planctomycetota bacterium]REJ94564.1 MAG: anti-sigma factor antagonist [Planctomycetota bacterium]REK18573.1 MAG: anti-sigma factor antagonist [Planctomycetota bacterium]REK37468.1 MAG: anti-sigma factor antagonist [Planctomycetota bacterium]